MRPDIKICGLKTPEAVDRAVERVEPVRMDLAHVPRAMDHARANRQHAPRCRVLNHRHGIEAVIQDRGPGIADIESAMQDHVSSSGTLGLGLPGTKRMVDEFDIQSTPGAGTTVRVVVWA